MTLNAYRPPLNARGLLDGLRPSRVAVVELRTNQTPYLDARDHDGFAAEQVVSAWWSLYPNRTECN